MRCEICESVYHPTRECPEKIYYQEEEEEFNEESTYDVILYQSNLVLPNDYSIFIAEASVSAILDSGASSNVAGRKWMDSYLEGLPETERREVTYEDSSTNFRFGNSYLYKSIHKLLIPAKIGGIKVGIKTDVVEADIPLLLSKEAMKAAGTEINFVTDQIKMFGKDQEVILTSSGHYALPLNNSVGIMKEVERNEKVKVTLVAAEKKEDKMKTALKLHAQFGHPPKAKLIRLIRRAGRGDDKELIGKFEEVEKNCKICKEYAKPSPRPIVGLPHAANFNETVAMDLFFFQGKVILHMIDHLTRFSVAKVCKNKQPAEIIKGIFEGWVSVFGPPKKFLSDNGGEFANEEFLKMAESLNVRVMHTSAESPWSNGLVERHNGTLKCMLEKIVGEKNLKLDIALPWAIQAKNALDNVHGFSPAQLTFGKNPQIPNVMINEPPALEEMDAEGMVARQLGAMREAREAFMKAESAEKIRRALRHNIRPSARNVFVLGDTVYYKRNDSRKWRGPGTVIGKESATILIKHGAQYVRVHVCRVLPVHGVAYDYKGDTVSDLENSGNENRPEIQKHVDESESEEESKKNEVEEEQDEEDQEEEQEDDGEKDGNDEEEGEEEIVNNYIEDENSDGEQNSAFFDAMVEAEEVVQQNISTALDKDESKKLRVGENVEYKTSDGEWHKGKVIRRTGKATGKYKNFWEVAEAGTQLKTEYDTENDWISWKVCEKEENRDQNASNYSVYVVEDSAKQERKRRVEEAKSLELTKWKEEKVYEEVENNGQPCISTTWVITEKEVNGEVLIKARLVIRGYEEENKPRADSPTCNKDNIRILLALAVTKDWHISSLDIKAAFLQGKRIEREIYIEAPVEAEDQACLWKLRKVVYGLSDASRSWYLKVATTLAELGVGTLKVDGAVFLWRKKEEVEGVIIVHVDDMLYFGSQEFHLKVIKKLKNTFKISRDEQGSFKYLGVNMVQTKHEITMEQRAYVEGLQINLIDKELLKDKNRYATVQEMKLFRHGVGQLGWLENTTRPEIGFTFCQLSTVQTKPQMRDFSIYAKAVKEMKSCDSLIRIVKLDTSTLVVKAYSDASYGNLPGGGSQLGYIVFLCDAKGNAVPISWTSKKAKRVARSTLTAETFAAGEGVDSARLVKLVIEEVLGGRLPPIELYVDNKSLVDTVHTTNTISEKSLRIDMAALRQMVDRKELKIQWVSHENQLADVLTKQGANKEKLRDVLSKGILKN